MLIPIVTIFFTTSHIFFKNKDISRIYGSASSKGTPDAGGGRESSPFRDATPLASGSWPFCFPGHARRGAAREAQALFF